MEKIKNKKMLFIIPIIVVFLLLVFIIPNSGAIYRESLPTSVNLDIENSEYRVVFNGNGNTGGSTASKTCEYSVDCKLTANGFTKEGYHFDGWATTANGTKAYDDQDEVLNLILTGDYPLYAKWAANELEFNNQTINKTYTGTSQTINIVEATNGTGEYTYTKKSEKNSSNSNTNYISISGTTLTIDASTIADTYTVVITASDTNSGVSKDATYTVVIGKATPTVTLTAKSGMIYTGSEQVANTATVTLVNNETYSGDIDYTYYTDNSCTVPYVASASETILRKAKIAGQLNQIPGTNIYIFKGGNPANYVKFNGENWRIIGIYGDQLKIQKVEAPSGLTSVPYHTSRPNPEWKNTSLKQYLNTTYYNSLSENGKNMIVEGTWNVGAAAYNAIAKDAYKGSTTVKTVGSTNYTTPDTGKVGIMATYEFLYASSGAGCENVAGNHGVFNSQCGSSSVNWMRPSFDSWTLTPGSDYSNLSLFINAGGGISGTNVDTEFQALPVVFLNRDALIVSGDGTTTETAYVLGMDSSLAKKSVSVNAGTYYTKATVSETTNYNEAESACVAHNIAKSNTTTTLTAITKEYTGLSQVASGAISTLSSNNSAITDGEYTYTYYEGTSCDGVALASAPVNAGVYRVKATLTSTNNYNSSTSSCTAYTINKTTPTVTLTEKTGMVYNGNAQEANQATVTLVNNETYTGDIEYTYYTNNSCTLSYNESGLVDVAGAKRYVGSDPNNYIRFNGELWRIIGIYGNNLKIINVTSPITNIEYSNNWDNTWEDSILKETLNTTYYNSLTANAKLMIKENSSWNIGATDFLASAEEAYADARTDTWTGNVGLLASYEYLYGSIEECHTVSGEGSVFFSGENSCGSNDWLNPEEWAWTMTPYYDDPANSLAINSGGYVAKASVKGNNFIMYPVVYLKSSVGITSGDGSYQTPYEVSLNSNTGLDSTPINVGSYYVKARTESFGNYSAAESACVAHNIAKSDTTTTLAEITKEFTGTSQEASGAVSTLSSNNSTITDGEYTYTYYEGTSCDGVALASAPVNAGVYRVKATLTSTNNYNSSTSSCTAYTINKTTPTVTLTEKTGMVYNGNAQEANQATVTLVNNETYTGDIDYTYYTDNACTILNRDPAANIILQRGEKTGELVSIGDNNYIFKGGNPANYVKFNGEDWRIVGIYNGHLKIQRVATIENQIFNSETPNPGWLSSSLKNYLNTTYYNSLGSEAKQMIDNTVNWNIGKVAYDAIASDAYTNAKTVTWKGSDTSDPGIGLISTYEFMYGSSKEGCITTPGNGGSFNLSCGTAEYDWLKPNSVNIWTISPLLVYDNDELLVSASGDIFGYSVDSTNGLLPVVYLKNEVSIESGDGTSTTNGYVLKLEGSTTPVNAGEYYAKASITAQGNYNGSESSCVAHTIGQKKATINLGSAPTLTYGTNGVLTYTYDGDGEISCTSSDTTKVTCNVDTENNIINIVPVAATEDNITITISAGAGSNYSGADNKTVTIEGVGKGTPTVNLTEKTGMIYTGSSQVANTATVTPETGGEVTYSYYTDNACTVPFTPPGLTTSDIREIAWNAGQLNQIPDTNIYIFKGGTSAQPANYVKFNGEDWRIIGIYNGQMKIIRVNSSGVPTAPTGFTSIAWNSSQPNPGWANSSLKESLNTTYYNTLSDTATDMIDENGSWDVGPAAYNATASEAYTSATTNNQTVGSITHTTPWTGKVGLMASYEFLYATGGGDSCLTTAGSSYNSSCGTAANDWLLNTGADLWTLSPRSGDPSSALYVYSVCFVNGYHVGNSTAAVPAVFLKSSVKLDSGQGTSSSPYILK